ncbi:hypothetical protein LMG31506_01151 [Cupriavidus yeoncheonensis]|uniref:Uncharacterized protein n=1 Tax=Cupriavidus yeoncheonensis TaxID=1462994 RepID=A0A916IS91_9BURK|nr:hypothetical protein LMG31506_01151 [Cupriavidus yeoncheonensis]
MGERDRHRRASGMPAVHVKGAGGSRGSRARFSAMRAWSARYCGRAQRGRKRAWVSPVCSFGWLGLRHANPKTDSVHARHARCRAAAAEIMWRHTAARQPAKTGFQKEKARTPLRCAGGLPDVSKIFQEGAVPVKCAPASSRAGSILHRRTRKRFDRRQPLRRAAPQPGPCRAPRAGFPRSAGRPRRGSGGRPSAPRRAPRRPRGRPR